MASHYGTAMIPAHPYKPRDKAKVEVAFRLCGVGSGRACATAGSSL